MNLPQTRQLILRRRPDLFPAVAADHLLFAANEVATADAAAGPEQPAADDLQQQTAGAGERFLEGNGRIKNHRAGCSPPEGCGQEQDGKNDGGAALHWAQPSGTVSLPLTGMEQSEKNKGLFMPPPFSVRPAPLLKTGDARKPHCNASAYCWQALAGRFGAGALIVIEFPLFPIARREIHAQERL